MPHDPNWPFAIARTNRATLLEMVERLDGGIKLTGQIAHLNPTQRAAILARKEAHRALLVESLAALDAGAS